MKIVLCDDTPAERERYSAILHALAEKHKIKLNLCQYENGTNLLFDFEMHGYIADVIFLDINMPEMSGVEVAHELRRHKYINEIVFVTVSKNIDHLLKAFDVKAINYIVKGETDEQRFEEIFLNAIESAKEKESEYIQYTAHGEKRYIAIDKIKYYEVKDRIINVYYENTKFEFYSTLEKVEKDLEFEGFVRIHRSFLIALDQVESTTKNSVTLRCGETLPVGRKYYANLKNNLEFRM